MPHKLRFRLYEELREALEDTGASPEQIKYSAAEWRKATAIVYACKIAKLVSKAHPDKPRLADKLSDLINVSNWVAPTSTQIESILKAEGAIPDSDSIQLIEDMKNFEETGEILDADRLAQAIDKND